MFFKKVKCYFLKWLLMVVYVFYENENLFDFFFERKINRV